MKKAGDAIDRYVIEAVLGRGGMGEVYEATDTRLGRRVAVKLILAGADPTANVRMLREARAAASFQHPNAVVVFDVGEADGSTYLAMELVRGRPLRAYVGDRSVSVARRIRWLVDVARALGAAHRAGLVHRDVKPDNVMVRDDGVVKVLDFGIARRANVVVDASAPTDVAAPSLETLTAKGVLVATPMYAAPEQLRKEPIDGRTDQFAWAVMAYELLAGVPPWRTDDTLALLAQILSSSPAPLGSRAPEVPDEVLRAVHRSLEKGPSARFETIDEAADAFEPHADAPIQGARGPSGAPPPRHPMDGSDVERAVHTTRSPISRSTAPPPTRRRRVWVALAALALVVPICMLVAVAMKKVRERRDATAPAFVVQSLRCQRARLRGHGVAAERQRAEPDAGIAGRAAALSEAPDLAAAIGVGACARLAVDLGVEWNASEGPALDVRAKIDEGKVEVELDVEGRSAEASGATPMEAIARAIQTLRPKLAPPPMGDDEVRAWGAKDAASARRIRRLLRQIELRFASNLDADVAELTANDPSSPWPYALANFSTLWGSKEWFDARDKALERVDKLPPARAHVLRGALLLDKSPAHREQALALLRRGYSEDPDEPDVAGIYAYVLLSEGLRDEGLAALDRLYARHPTRTFFALRRALGELPDRDLERDRTQVERMVSTLPESRAWFHPVQYFVIGGKLDDARAAVKFGREFGMTGDSTEGAFLDQSEAQIALASLDPQTARDVGRRLLSDPRQRNAASGATFTIAAYRMEGRLVDAATLEVTEIERHKNSGSTLIAAVHAMDELRHRRWLGQPPADVDVLDWLDTALGHSTDVEPSLTAAARTEVAVARLRADPVKGKSVATRILAEAEQLADKTRPGDKPARDAVLAATLPLQRALRGDEAAVRRWRETDRAPFVVRRHVAFDAGLALEAVGDPEGARRAYTLAQDPIDIESCSFVAVAARLRAATLDRAMGAPERAAHLEAEVARVWSAADPDLVERVRALK